MAEINPQEIVKRLIHSPGSPVSHEEAVALAAAGPELTGDILYCAEQVRKKNKRDSLFVCSILNAKSGSCSQDCAFCAQSSFHNTGVETYDLLSVDEMTSRAIAMEKGGATRYSIVTSGHALNDEEIDQICQAVRIIKEKTSLIVCGSLGMLSRERAEKLIASGMTRYHHNLETARSHFDSICTTHPYDEDIETVKTARAVGFDVCCGGIFGLGETWEQRVELAFTLKDLDIDTIPLNFLNPVSGTKLEKMPLLKAMDALKCIALIRLINPDKSIAICGGREIVLNDFQSWIFKSGADGLMAGNYLTTLGRSMEMDMRMIQDAGLNIT